MKQEEKNEKDGGMVLLEAEHFEQTNPWNQPVVGWTPTTQGVGGLQNSRGWAFLRVVLWKLQGGQRVSLYEQSVIVENPAAIVICQLYEKVGLVKNFRMVGSRLLPDAGSQYIARLQKERLWSMLVESVGEWKWEAPRGLIHIPPREMNLEEFVIKSAKLEALQEAGFRIKSTKLVGRINVNSTFFLHPQWVVHALIEETGSSKPEDLEIIGESRLFTRQELRELNRRGEFDDGLTLGALALCGISF